MFLNYLSSNIGSYQFFPPKFLHFLQQNFRIFYSKIFAFFTAKFLHFLQQNFCIFYSKIFAFYTPNFFIFDTKIFAFLHQNFCIFYTKILAFFTTKFLHFYTKILHFYIIFKKKFDQNLRPNSFTPIFFEIIENPEVNNWDYFEYYGYKNLFIFLVNSGWGYYIN